MLDVYARRIIGWSIADHLRSELVTRCSASCSIAKTWTTRKELASAIFEWIEAWYNPHRRHSMIAMHSPVEHERLYTARTHAA